jgi:hypothetical protein
MSQITITKEQALAAYDGNGAALARALNITPSAVSQWPEGPIGEVHALKLRFLLKPEVFGPVVASIAKAG